MREKALLKKYIVYPANHIYTNVQKDTHDISDEL